MSPETPSKTTKLCPTCGTRQNEDATRCLVCGTDLTSTENPSKPAKVVQGTRMPLVTLGLPAILGLFALFLTIGAGSVYFALQRTNQTASIVLPTDTPTITETATATLTPTPPTPTPTDTPQPSATPQSYTVQANDTCSTIAFAFGVSVNSIVLLNNLPATCDTIFEGQQLLIPQPTPTPTDLPTATLGSDEATRSACGEIEYLVQENDTLSSIAANYAISITALKEYNGLVNDTVRSGVPIKIPLCQRAATAGPSPTPTPPPPYASPNLLLPAHGAAFTIADQTITLQWAAVGTLRENEAYAVLIEDITAGEEKFVDYVTDTKYIVPSEFQPGDSSTHIIGWSVLTVRQTGTDVDGNPIWEEAGAASIQRMFSWAGTGAQATPTP